MRRFITLLILLISASFVSFAMKDTEAWKGEKSIEQQYIVFKKGLNSWRGYYSLSEPQLNQFYKAISDTIAELKKEVIENESQVKVMLDELNSNIKETEEIQSKLTRSIQLENSISVLGVDVNRSVYSFSMYILIIGVLLISGLLFLLYKRSNRITQRTKKDLEELKEEFELHKKNSLDRYVKMNIELTKTRFELNKK